MALSNAFNNYADRDPSNDNDGNDSRRYGGTIGRNAGEDILHGAPVSAGASRKTVVAEQIELSTTFDNIPEKDREKRIKALRKSIDDKLVELTKSLAIAQGTPDVVMEWYGKNTMERVHAAVVAGTTPDRAAIEKEIPEAMSSYATLEKVKTQSGQRMTHKEFFDGFMSTQPEYGFLGSMSGKLAREQDIFLGELKEAGETILNRAAQEVAAAQQKLEDMKEQAWKVFSHLHGFYAGVTKGILERDSDGVLNLINNTVKEGTPSRAVRMMLEKPVRGHANVLTALTSFSLSPREEMEIAARIMIALGDDFEAMNLINGAINTIKDKKQKRNYQGYADAYVGTYVPTDSNSVFNANAIIDAVYNNESGNLTLHIPGGGKGVVDWQASQIASEEADGILRQLYRRRNFAPITETTGFSTDNLIQAHYDPMGGFLKWSIRGGSTGKIARNRMVDRTVALDVLSDIANDPGFMLLPEGTVLNARAVRAISYDTDKQSLVWKTSGGDAGYADHSLPMPQSDAVKVLVRFANDPSMAMLSLTEFVAKRSIHSIEYNEKDQRLTCLLRGGPDGYTPWFSETVEKESATEVLKKLEASGFHPFNNGSYLNAELIQSVTYDPAKARMIYRLNGGKTSAHELWIDQTTQSQANAIFKGLTKLPGFEDYIHPNKNTAINSKFLQSLEYLPGSDTLAYCLKGGKDGCVDLDTPADIETAQDIINKLTGGGKYISFKSMTIVDKAAIISAWHEPRKFNYQLGGGQFGHVDWELPMSARDTTAIMQELNKDADFHILGNRLVRLSKMVHAAYLPESGEVMWTMIGSKEGTFTDREKVSPDQAKELLRALRTYGQRDYLARNFNIAHEDIDDTIKNAREADKQVTNRIGSLVEYVPWAVFASSSFISDPDAGLTDVKIDFPEDQLNEMNNGKNPLLDLIPKKRRGVQKEDNLTSLLELMEDSQNFGDGSASNTMTETFGGGSNEILPLPGNDDQPTCEQKVLMEEEELDAAFNTDDVFSAYEAEKEAEFLSVLRSSATVADAATRWSTLDETDKIAVLDNIVRLQASVYGFEAVPVIPMLEEPKENKIIAARFNPLLDEIGCIEINVHPQGTFHEFLTAVESVAHENMHNWQGQLAAAIKNGTLTEDSPLYKQARDFKLALDAADHEDFSAYLARTTERHARKSSTRIHTGLAAHLDSVQPVVTMARQPEALPHRKA